MANDNRHRPSENQPDRQRDIEDEAEYWRTYQGKGRCLLILIFCAASGSALLGAIGGWVGRALA